jgi:acetyl esterase/lipase
LHIHGGAFVAGSAYGYRPHAGALAAAAQTGVLLPDYRLPPEHPFPAGVEDSLSAYTWLLEQGVRPAEVTLSGDSSGAGLVLSLLLTLRQDHAELPGAVVLLCPWVDLRLANDTPAPSAVFTIEEARRCAQMYLGGHSADDPIVNPLAAELGGFPPMLIQAATGDARLADAKALAAHARAHGVDVRLDLFPVDAHAFHIFWSFLPEAADAIEGAGSFIRASRSTAHRPRSDIQRNQKSGDARSSAGDGRRR